MSLLAAKKKLLMAQKKGPRVQDVFNTSLWSGSSAARTITTGIDSGEGSLVWIKARDVVVEHVLFDTARGPLNRIATSDSNAAGTLNGSLTEFAASGYSLGSQNRVNDSTYTYVGWQFRRAPKFFDIVQYTGNGASGRAIAHDLGIKPGMMVIKRLDTAQNWAVYHQSRTATEYAGLNLTNAFASSSGFWNNTEPTSTNFTVGNSALVNASGGTYIAYLFAHDTAADGFIQCGSYTGNGSSTGPVVNLGWRPQYLLIKRATGGTGSWYLSDAPRGLAGPNIGFLYPDLSAIEDVLSASSWLQSTSAGFQINTTNSAFNASGSDYIYMTIREAA